MLTVTEDVCKFAKQMLAETSAPEGTCVRIDLDKDGKGQVLIAQELPEDFKYEHAGETVLVVSQQAAEQFAGKTLDTESTEKGARMIVR